MYAAKGDKEDPRLDRFYGVLWDYSILHAETLVLGEFVFRGNHQSGALLKTSWSSLSKEFIYRPSKDPTGAQAWGESILSRIPGVEF